jgi:hypothetical protein
MANVINATSTGNGGLVSTGDDSGILNIQTNETTAITVDASQNVGIGTTSPSYKLHVVSSSASTPLLIDGGTNTYFGIKNSSQTAYLGAVGTVMYFENNGSERMRIDSSGNLLVGATSSATPASATSKIVSQGSFGAGAGAYGLSISSTTTGINQFYISFQTATTTERGYIWYNNTAGQVQLSATSDFRLKQNIADAPSTLSILEQVKVRQYDWKDTGSTNIGFIAQELYDVIPRAVAVGEDNEDGSIKRTWGVDNATLVPYLVKAIQEQQALITAQAETINALTARIVALETA